jgi:septum formation protein
VVWKPLSGRRLILASSSPRRAQLLRQVGIPFRRMKVNVEEDLSSRLAPADYVLSLAEKKARSAASQLKRGLVLGADTIVLFQGKILEKPQDAQEAKEMLSRLSGHTHQVYTGLALIDMSEGRTAAGYEITNVRFRSLSPDFITSYVETGEPLDKAGAYGVQKKGALLVERVEGCFYNVVGLPLSKLLALLQELGYGT